MSFSIGARSDGFRRQMPAQNRFAQLDYVARKNPKGAVRLDAEIERQIDRLAIYPEMGRIGRVDGTRELVIVRTPYIAVYRLARGRIEALRLLMARSNGRYR